MHDQTIHFGKGMVMRVVFVMVMVVSSGFLVFISETKSHFRVKKAKYRSNNGGGDDDERPLVFLHTMHVDGFMLVYIEEELQNQTCKHHGKQISSDEISAYKLRTDALEEENEKQT